MRGLISFVMVIAALSSNAAYVQHNPDQDCVDAMKIYLRHDSCNLEDYAYLYEFLSNQCNSTRLSKDIHLFNLKQQPLLNMVVFKTKQISHSCSF